MPRARAKSPIPKATRREAGVVRKMVGPMEAIVLRRPSGGRVDQLDYSVEIRPIGTDGTRDRVVARFLNPDDQKIYGSVLARRHSARIIDHT